MAITADDMRDKLIPMDKVRELLATTEPISSHGFPTGDAVKFRVDGAWNHGLDEKTGDDLVDAYVKVGKGPGSTEFQLTKDALLEATSICGLPKGYVSRSPSKLVEPQLNYWFREGLENKDYKVLCVGDTAKAMTRSTVNPFSNLRLLDETLAGIEKLYGKGEVLADYKFQHSLRQTDLRLIVPEKMREIQRTGRDDDNWSIGIQLKNSLIGASQTSLDGYAFAWWCTNGSISTECTSGTWSRRSGGQGDEVYEWARFAVDEILGGMEGELDKVQALVDVEVGDETSQVLAELFAQYRVPTPLRNSIIESMVDEDDLNMYSIMQAITAAANHPDVTPGHAELLMRAGGDLPRTGLERCSLGKVHLH